ncbi:MAG: hypothetical protein WCL32_09430 [Planctomycetota bacterium]
MISYSTCFICLLTSLPLFFDEDNDAALEAAIVGAGGAVKRNENLSYRPITEVDLRGAVNPSPALSKLWASQHLHSVNLGQSKIANRDLKYLAACKAIESVYLTGCPLTHEGLLHLSKLPKLAHVSVGPNGFSDRELAVITKLDRLISLDIELAEKAAIDQLPLLRQLDRLKFLRVRGSAFGDGHASIVSELKSLEKLELSATSVTDKGVEELIVLPNLSTLTLLNAEITDMSLVKLQECPNLQYLNLVLTKVTPAGVKTFRSDNRRISLMVFPPR